VEYEHLPSRRDRYTDARIDHHDGGIRRHRLTGETQRASFGIGSITDRNEGTDVLGRVRQSCVESRSAGRVVAA
jgi:hypothetical protein